MADKDDLGGLLGDGDEVDEARDDVQLSPLDAGAAALAIEAMSSQDPRLPPEAAEYYRTQTRLVEIQTEHLHEQRAWQLSHLQIQVSHLKLRRFLDRLRAVTQVVIIAVAVAVGLGLAVMLHDAFTSRDVIVEPFDAPPALAARGLSGKVVAVGLLDQLTRLRAATQAQAARRNLTGAWHSDVRIEVPQTGVSFGELSRALRARFGNDVHIEGDLVQTPSGGLALTVRGDGVAPKSFNGGADDLERLTAEAAEYVYGGSQPGLYAAWLVTMNRNAEAVEFARRAYSSAPAEDRPFLLNSWANALEQSGGSARTALGLYRAALKLKPDYWTAWDNVVSSLILLQDEEGAWREGEAMRAAAGGERTGSARELSYQNWDYLTWNLMAWRAALLSAVEANATTGAGLPAAGPDIADVDVRLRDWAAAGLDLQLAPADRRDPNIDAISHFVRGRLAAEAGDTATAVAEMEAFGAAYADPIVSSSYPGYACWIAPVEEAAGHPDKADAALAAGGRYVDCYRFRADILDRRGDWPDAQGAYAAAVALAPDLPAAWYSWGAALARHGDLGGAAAKFAEANRRGPHWADPLKLWGDVLARQGRWHEAVEKYDAALEHAPAWADLRQARAAAASH